MSTAEAMASLHATTQSVSIPSLLEMHDRLDSLWISYLRHLDTYTSAQKAMQQHLRSGFFSLSRANFNARPGMRYGQDYFHDRAIATRKVEVKQSEGDGGSGGLRLAVVNKQQVSSDDMEGITSETNAGVGEKQQQPSSPPAPEPTDDDVDSPADGSAGNPNESSKADDAATSKSATSKPPLEADPLRWFGILVPQELRSAQTSFSPAVNESSVDAVNAGRAMREVEVEIRKLRKDIRKAEKVAKGRGSALLIDKASQKVST